MKAQVTSVDHPFFSICIPQYNRTSFLIEACRSLAAQTFKDFEVCISDDCSTDGKEEQLLQYLRQSGLSFVYQRQQHNLKYDANLRASIGMSRGRYCFLLGNDDALGAPTTLEEVYEHMRKGTAAGAVITNFKEYATGRLVRRIPRTGVLGAGPIVAAANYRNASFVSGIILDGKRARELGTAKWDGSEMYQVYLMCRIVAEGGLLLGLNEIVVAKDIQVPGEEVDSYARKPRLHPCPLRERRHTFHLLGRLVVDAVQPYTDPASKHWVHENILRQLLLFTYPFWIFEFRRVQSWKYAAGICLGMRPQNITADITLGLPARLRIALLYSAVSLVGLVVPVRVFDRCYRWLYAVAKRSWTHEPV